LLSWAFMRFLLSCPLFFHPFILPI
jgi:hypothetical protein